MSDSLVHHQYQEWPSEPADREALAREAFGEHVVDVYDDWLKIATDTLFRGYRHGGPTEEQRRLLDWIASLGDEERVHALALIREMIEGVVYGILCKFDALGGSVLQGDVREQLLVSVAIAPWNVEAGWVADERLDVITINTKESREKRGIELHRLWFSWKEKYSRWQGEQGQVKSNS